MTRHRTARGRHRKPTQPRIWIAPTALGVVAAAALALMIYTTNGLVRSDPASAALVMSGGPAPTSSTSIEPPPSSTSTPTTSTTTSTPPETTETTEPEPTSETTTEEAPPPEPVEPEPQACSTDLENTEPHVAQVGHHVLTRFAVDSVGGRAGRANASDHPVGLALDFMVDPAVGDELSEYLVAHQAEFGITYVIWYQRINSGSGWTTMEDRGSPTANHMDHVHVSFAAGADVAVIC
ncbi:hypothetical protein [Saccharomonospora sp. NB11]|uniref:hypothetical protein n=1 Tax=Saccharomonospora sp. NB11 TaxID=1642298 RepID=UPI0018D01CAE|nr:hypothetical protein [Saccharomonospora sp. NB11]